MPWDVNQVSQRDSPGHGFVAVLRSGIMTREKLRNELAGKMTTGETGLVTS